MANPVSQDISITAFETPQLSLINTDIFTINFRPS